MNSKTESVKPNISRISIGRVYNLGNYAYADADAMLKAREN